MSEGLGNGITAQGSPPKPSGPLAAWGLSVPRWTIWSIGVLVLVGMAILSEQWFPSAPAPAKSEPAVKPLSLSPQKAEHEAWLATAQGQIKSLEQELQAMSKKQERLEQALKERQATPLLGGVLPPGMPTTPPAPGGGPRPVLKTAGTSTLPTDSPPPMRASESARPAPPPATPPASGPSATIPASGAAPGPPVSGPLVGPPGSSGVGSAAAGSGKLRVVATEPAAPPGRYWLPTGTILPVRLLSGVDAPTGGTGTAGGMASQPHPVLMQVIDLAKLPNEATMDATGCFALGEGMGDISTERAMIRMIGLSCVKEDGQAVDMPVKGVVTGEDGKVGMRGRVVIRESSMLARTLLTGFVSGIAKAFMPFQMGLFVAPSASQALQFPDPQNVGLAGMAGGMQQAAQMLAQHYAQMAARIYPVIEVDAGRWADLIVTEGRTLAEPLRESPSS